MIGKQVLFQIYTAVVNIHQSPYISINTRREFFLRVFDDLQQLNLICSGYNAEHMRWEHFRTKEDRH